MAWIPQGKHHCSSRSLWLKFGYAGESTAPNEKLLDGEKWSSWSFCHWNESKSLVSLCWAVFLFFPFSLEHFSGQISERKDKLAQPHF